MRGKTKHINQQIAKPDVHTYLVKTTVVSESTQGLLHVWRTKHIILKKGVVYEFLPNLSKDETQD